MLREANWNLPVCVLVARHILGQFMSHINGLAGHVDQIATTRGDDIQHTTGNSLGCRSVLANKGEKMCYGVTWILTSIRAGHRSHLSLYELVRPSGNLVIG